MHAASYCINILMKCLDSQKRKLQNQPCVNPSSTAFARGRLGIHFQMSCCAREALRMGTPLFLWQQRGNLKQGHINWPRYCNPVHKGQYPGWEDVCLLGGHTNYCVSAQASISVHQRLAGHWPVIIRWIYPVTFASAFIRPSIRWHPPTPRCSRGLRWGSLSTLCNDWSDLIE